MVILRPIVAVSLLLLAIESSGTESSSEKFWVEGTGGATRDFYSLDGRVKWRNPLGDWIDRNGELGGAQEYSTGRLTDIQISNSVDLDVTAIVRKWISLDLVNHGFFLRLSSHRATAHVFSKETGETSPILRINTANSTYKLRPEDDTYLTPSSFKPMGNAQVMEVSETLPALIYFSLSDFQSTSKIVEATLSLQIKKTFGPMPIDVSVFAIASPKLLRKGLVENTGLSNQYPGDAGIDKHPAVLFSNSFENSNWRDGFRNKGETGSIRDLYIGKGYEPLCGRSLQATIPKGENLGLNASYLFDKNRPTTEAYARYYLRFGNEWNQVVSGGKLPGFSGTYGKAGWGGRRGNGYDGWSARGSFGKTITLSSSANSRLTSIGSYVYHLDQPENYGDNWVWDDQGTALLENDRWYSIEQYIKLNDPGLANGQLKAWIDGQLAFERTKLTFRESSQLHIEEFWFNFYHGGIAPATSSQSLYIDNIVIAKSYIGPGMLVNKEGTGQLKNCK